MVGLSKMVALSFRVAGLRSFQSNVKRCPPTDHLNVNNMSKKKTPKSASASIIPSYPPPPTVNTYRLVGLSETSTSTLLASEADMVKLRVHPGDPVIITLNGASYADLSPELLPKVPCSGLKCFIHGVVAYLTHAHLTGCWEHMAGKTVDFWM